MRSRGIWIVALIAACADAMDGGDAGSAGALDAASAADAGAPDAVGGADALGGADVPSGVDALGGADAEADLDAGGPADALVGVDAAAHDAGPPARAVAFASDRQGEYDVFLTDLSGAAPRALSGMDGNDFNPTFTPDGARVVFSGTRGNEVHLFEIELASGATTRIETPGLSRASTPSVSPDDCCIAFEGVITGDFNPDIYLLRRGGAPTRLTNTASQDGAPVFSRDGQQLFFTSNRDGGFHVYSMALDGTNVVRETASPGVLGRPTVSADGQRLAFARFDQARRRAFIVELTRGSRAERTLSDQDDYEPSYAAAGDVLLFATSRFGGSELMVLELTGGAAARRLTMEAAIDGQPAIAP